MRQRSFILVAVTVTVLIASAVAAYAYDSSRDDRIAKGVTVAGVDVGDMSVADAKAKIKHELAGSLSASRWTVTVLRESVPGEAVNTSSRPSSLTQGSTIHSLASGLHHTTW